MLLSINHSLTKQLRIVIRINAHAFSSPVNTVIANSSHATHWVVCGVSRAWVTSWAVKSYVALWTSFPDKVLFACTHITRNVLKMFSHFLLFYAFMSMHDVVNSLTDSVSVASISTMVDYHSVSDHAYWIHLNVSHYLFFLSKTFDDFRFFLLHDSAVIRGVQI